jgi:predicted RNase H-like nuclease (RuvC/YqgF family)
LPADFPDGTSNTLLVVEAGKAVPWTKPEDLPYAPTGQLPPLGGAFRGVINAALADGAVIALKRAFREKALRRAIERNDGENWDRDDLIGWAPNRSDPAVLKKENARLRESLRKAQDEVRQLRQEWLERARANRRPRQDRETEQLWREHRALQEELDRVREEAAQLREQIDLLRKSGKGPREDE